MCFCAVFERERERLVVLCVPPAPPFNSPNSHGAENGHERTPSERARCFVCGAAHALLEAAGLSVSERGDTGRPVALCVVCELVLRLTLCSTQTTNSRPPRPKIPRPPGGGGSTLCFVCAAWSVALLGGGGGRTCGGAGSHWFCCCCWLLVAGAAGRVLASN